MREVKYRAWDSDGQYIFTPDHFTKNGNGFDCWDSQQDGLVYSENLMQQIGLKDDKGNDIFEGDVIRVQFDDSISIDYYVEYDNWNCNFFGVFIKQNGFNGSPNRNNRGFCDLRRERGIQVIGNIHENPELLN